MVTCPWTQTHVATLERGQCHGIVRRIAHTVTDLQTSYTVRQGLPSLAAGVELKLGKRKSWDTPCWSAHAGDGPSF